MHKRVKKTYVRLTCALIWPSTRMIDTNYAHFETRKSPENEGDRASACFRRKMRAVHLSHIPSDARNASSRVSAHTVHNYSSMWLTYRLSSFSSPLFALTKGFIWRFFLFAIFLCSVLAEFFCFGIQFGHWLFNDNSRNIKISCTRFVL